MKQYTHISSVQRHGLAGKINLTIPAIALALLACASAVRAQDGEVREPELPSPLCDSVNVPAGNRLATHVYALGVQIYRWNGTGWAFVGPEARLFGDSCYNGQVGVHYASPTGPVWEATDGSLVVGARDGDCTPFRGAIPWLRLKATTTAGDGVFARVSYIQRVNTIGGTAPAQPGAFVGDEARVPYTTEYYFYRANNQ